jgi:hypothetical protein
MGLSFVPFGLIRAYSHLFLVFIDDVPYVGPKLLLLFENCNQGQVAVLIYSLCKSPLIIWNSEPEIEFFVISELFDSGAPRISTL